MLTDEDLPPLPMFESTHARPDGIVTLYREEEILEWGRAVERAAYAAAIKACDRIAGNHRQFSDERRRGAGMCSAEISALKEQPK